MPKKPTFKTLFEKSTFLDKFSDCKLSRNIFTPDINFEEFFDSNESILNLMDKILYFNEDSDVQFYKSEVVFTIHFYGTEYWVYIGIHEDNGSCLTCDMHSSYEKKMYIAESLDSLLIHHIGPKNALFKSHLNHIYS
jgi:hypothetical protein